jgi:hypothetical protein
MDVSVGVVTVSVAVPLMPLSDALIVEVPAATPVAIPVAATVAVAAVDEVHATLDVMFFEVPSL